MEDNIATRKQPNLPSNYVTLAQLQERWIKEQQIKQKEKEQQEEQNQKKLDNEEAEPEHLSQPIRRNSNRKSYRRNLIGTNVEESKAVSVAVLEENEKSKEMKRKGWTKKKKKKGEARAPEKEGEVAGSQAHALLVKNEKKNVRDERKREMQVEYGEKVEKVVEENNQTVEIEKEIGDLSIDKESEEPNGKEKVIKGRMKNKYRDCEQNQKKLHNEEAEPEYLSQPIRRNSTRKSYRRNLVATNVEESKAVSVAVLEENEKSKEMKRKGWTKKKKKGAARAPEEEGEVAGSEAHALRVKNEKKNVRYERKWEMRVEYWEKVEKVVEENNQTVEIKKEIGDLSIDKESEKSNRKNKVINGRMRNNYGDCDGYDNQGDRNHRGYNDGGDPGNGQYRECHRRYNSKNWGYGGCHRRFNGNEQRKGIDNGKVWVKKEEAADDGDMVGNQSSSGPLKELE